MAASSKVAALAGATLSLLPAVSGHGLLTKPASRNSFGGPNCEHCLNGPGICGDSSSSNHYLNAFNGVVATWTAGSVVEVEVKITAHHKGHYEFSVCEEVLDSSVSNPQACLDKWILHRATPEEAGFTDCQGNDRRPACQPVDARYPERFYLPPPGFSPDGQNTHRFFLKIPDGLTCNSCTMQWRWWSSNSCTPAPGYGCYNEQLASAGYDVAPWGLTKSWDGSASCPGGGCNRCSCGEEFRNCVDIAIMSSGGGAGTSTTAAPETTMLTPAPTPATVPTPSPTQMVTSSPTPQQTMAPGASCSPTNSAYRLYCENEAEAGRCPDPWCEMMDGPAPTPAIAPTTAPTPSATSSPTPAATPTAVPTERTTSSPTPAATSPGANCLPTNSAYRLYCADEAAAGRCPAPWCEEEAGSPTPEPTQSSCAPIGDCGESAWCSREKYIAWCEEQGRLGECPAPFCKA